MPTVSRRIFLLRSSIGAAAAGVAASVPGLASVIGGPVTSEAPVAEDLVPAGDAETAAISEPLVAHVKDLSTGEISVFSGTREVVTHDPQMANRLLRVLR